VTVIAFLDANVLYPATLRSVLMELALAGAFRSLWTERVHEEWTRSLQRDRPDLSADRIARTRALMLAHVEDAMVTGYEHLIEKITLPDPDDCHVLAAAIHGGALIIVTANVKDFPTSVLAPHGIIARPPDDFVCGLLTDDPGAVLAALAADRATLRNPPTTTATYLATLERAGLAEMVAILRALDDPL
jgi:predicted nucleic acid-binding protein